MDCCYLDRNESSTTETELPNVCSPEMFDSDSENDIRTIEILENNDATTTVSPEKPSQAELIVKSDNNLLARINKFMCGVPPPPKHTICRTDCSEFLLRIYENRHYFWTACPLPEKQAQAEMTHKSSEVEHENINRNNSYQRTRSTLRNLTNAFDACENSQNGFTNDSDVKNIKDVQGRINGSDDTKCLFNESKEETKVLNIKPLPGNDIKKKQVSFNQELPVPCHTITDNIYTISEEEAITSAWPEAYNHKFHGIHYNRSKSVEDFENLTTKLCERYIGAETQSTCTVWFSKAPGSARKRSLLAKRNIGQSPGKRLSHLTRRRRTFSSANLQGLALNNKKLLVLNIKKPNIKKGKSPRGKSPRGKSPRGKSPRSSSKKKVVRRLVLDGPSPLKSKLETSKRALFQSPPSDRAGPSKLFTSGPNPHNIKRALFPTPKKREDDSDSLPKNSVEETKKRKCEDELEGPRYKWAKSLSFDCPHELHNNRVPSWDQERHSSSNIVEKSNATYSQGRNELSDAHRKKLLWAVAQALRGKGIGMTHPQFKQYASNLARTIKKFMPDLENRNLPRKPGSTSDRMLELAKHHVLFIIDERPTD